MRVESAECGVRSENPLLFLRNVSVGYPGKIIVRDVSLELSAGEFCALLGLNGSGKTTLLKGICGLLPLSGGCCSINSTDLSVLNEKKRAVYVSMIPQRHSKLIGVTVLDAVLMGFNAKLGIFEAPSSNDKKTALEALEKMEIPHLINEDYSRLSEGQKQLVILARTLVQNTPLMLMDEPDSALDFSNKHMTLARIRKLVRDENKACLVSLHDPNLAIRYCDRLILLDNGEITSELKLSGAGRNDIQACLSTVYKDITVYEQNGDFRHFVG
jgi:iron complex transport system ATP-binding protein